MVPRFKVLVTEGEVGMPEEGTGLKFKIKSSVLDMFRMSRLVTEWECQIRQLDTCCTSGKLAS